jgi:hypothetical protein
MEPQRPPTCSPQNGCDLSMRIHKYGISAYVYACVIFFNVFDLFIYLFFCYLLYNIGSYSCIFQYLFVYLCIQGCIYLCILMYIYIHIYIYYVLICIHLLNCLCIVCLI